MVAWLWSLTPFVVKQGKEKRLTNRLQQWQSCHPMGGGGVHDSFDVHVSSQKKREGEGEGEGEEKALGIVAFSV